MQLAPIYARMPELPDLQVFSHNLSKRLVGQKVEKIHAVNSTKLKTPESKLQQALVGATLLSVEREGKELHLRFDNGNVLAVHLMLRGEMFFFHTRNENRFTIVEVLFHDGTGLAITDRMRQAAVTLNPQPATAPDAMDLDFTTLKQIFRGSKKTIKKVLTDQKIIRGIGNAYADEILWQARISPFSLCDKIPDAAIKKLASAIPSVFEKAEKSILKSNPDIIGGEIRDFLLIHHPGKTHSPTNCKIRVSEDGGRKTYYTEEQVLHQ